MVLHNIDMITHTASIVARFVMQLRGQAYYDRLYQAMHEVNAFQGDTWRAHLCQLREAIPDISRRTILDYGCGPKGGLTREFGTTVIPYDPYVPQFSTPPWDKSFDTVFSSDVLEHMSQAQINDFLRQVKTASPFSVFLVASTRKAQKLLPNGANAHLTVKPAMWWLGRVQQTLGHAYTPTLATADLIRDDVTLCFSRR
jgi:hypothetical protein